MSLRDKAVLLRQTESKGWKLLWSDDFNYRGLPDPKKWNYEEGLVRNKELQFYTRSRAENARVEDGRLLIEARREPFRGATYTAASLVTLGTFSFEYGRIEMRAKLPAGRGTWPAFWMMGEDIGRVGWPRCGEIDIMEHVAHTPGVIHANVHQIGDDGKHWSKGEQIPVPDCTSAFHVYAAEWFPDRLDFFVDDKKYLTFPYQGPGKWTFDRRCYLLLNLAIGGNWGGQKGVDESAFPQRYEVEYVRVFQKPR
ncbi:MAG: glycoside hydrolase family 16 protein [Cytophagales bacterium]|nr:glycoside hydrolase family 16 protein [Armatimonadota bacterium]